MIFERKVLRRIFGPTKERDGTGRIKTNDEIIRYKNKINHIKEQTLSLSLYSLYRASCNNIFICPT